MSDRIRTTPDAPFRPVGMGMVSNFMCDACAKPKAVLGRKLRRLGGMRTWVCGACAARASRPLGGG